MSRRRNHPQTPESTPPSIPPEKAIELLRTEIGWAEYLVGKRPIDDDEYSNWENKTRHVLVKVFGSASPNVEHFTEAGGFSIIPENASPEWLDNYNAKKLQSQIKRLQGLVEVLQGDIENSSATPHSPQISTAPGRNVFLVHGHNDAIRETAARFLEKLDLVPRILHEQPNKGRTIIEKFTDYSNVGFAVVLLTADDRGGVRAASYEQQQPRARQNVILELGFFLGKLGRDRVCPLYQEGVEIPSDYDGVLFVPLDDGGAWKFQLAREIKAAGIDVDLNKVL